MKKNKRNPDEFEIYLINSEARAWKRRLAAVSEGEKYRNYGEYLAFYKSVRQYRAFCRRRRGNE